MKASEINRIGYESSFCVYVKDIKNDFIYKKLKGLKTTHVQKEEKNE